MGKGYTIDGIPTAYWPVGYPAFLGSIFWVLGPNLLYAKLANVLLYVGILYLAYAIARELFSSEFTGRMTLLLLAFYPNHIAYSSLLSTENLYLFLLLLGVAALILERRDGIWKGISTGVVFGLACLVKPQTIFIPLLLILVLYLRRSDTRRLLAMVSTVYLALGAIMLPWTVRNYYVFDALFYISNNGGVTLFIGNNPHANGTYMPFDEELRSLLPLSPDDDEHDVDVKARKYALDYMLAHPAKTLRFSSIKLYYVYREDVEGMNWNNGAIMWEKSREPGHKALFWFLIGLAQNYYLCTMAAFAVSLPVLFAKRGSRSVPTLGLYIIAYFSAICMVTIGISRFHFPLIPWILMYVASLFEWTASRLGIDQVSPARQSP
jgi:4-amino-4-deoxy-L-arabinose transferase-like glycosyltransferase